MANYVYPELRRAIAEGELGDLAALAWAAQLYDSFTVYAGTDLVRADLTGTPLGDPLTLPSVAVVVTDLGSGNLVVDLTCDDSALGFTSVGPADNVEAMAIYVDTGVAATDTLGGYYDRRADTAPITFTGTGQPVPVTFPLGYFIRL